MKCKRLLSLMMASLIMGNSINSTVVSYAAEDNTQAEQSINTEESIEKNGNIELSKSVLGAIECQEYLSAATTIWESKMPFEVLNLVPEEKLNEMYKNLNNNNCYLLRTRMKYEFIVLLKTNLLNDEEINAMLAIISEIPVAKVTEKEKKEADRELLSVLNSIYSSDNESFETLDKFEEYLQKDLEVNVSKLMILLDNLENSSSEQNMNNIQDDLVLSEKNEESYAQEEKQELKKSSEMSKLDGVPVNGLEYPGEAVDFYATGDQKATGTWIQESNGRWWYKHTDGTYTTNGWEKIGDIYYYFDANGYMMQDSWIKGLYYVDAKGYWRESIVSEWKAFTEAVADKTVTKIHLNKDMTATSTAATTNAKNLEIVTRGKGCVISMSATYQGGSFLKNMTGASIRIIGKETEQIVFQNMNLSKKDPGIVPVNYGAIRNSGNLTLAYVQFKNNISPQGGAIFNDGVLDIDHCTFTGNKAENIGGAIINNKKAVINNSVFQKNGFKQYAATGANYIGFGGAVSNTDRVGNGASLIFRNCEFRDNGYQNGGKNEPTVYGGAFYAGGCKNDSTLPETTQMSLNFENCVFGNNTAINGGAIYAEKKIHLNACVFDGNKAYQGGGSAGGAIRLEYAISGADIVGCEFRNNYAQNVGGVIYTDIATTIDIKDSVFEHNSSKTRGGAIENHGTMSVTGGKINQNESALGGGIGNSNKSSKSSLILSDVIILDNQATNQGGAVHNENGSTTITGGTTSGNMATKGEGIYQNGALYIKNNAQINTDNDIFLPENRIVTITDVLTKKNEVIARITPEIYELGRALVHVEYDDKLASEEFFNEDKSERFVLTPKDDFAIRPGDYVTD